MSPPSGSTAGDIPHRGVDPQIWRACAGASVQIPLLYSRVYYFPQGHIEHCCPSSSLPSITYPVPCLVTSIELLADPVTDEVFAHLLLQPVALEQFIPTNCSRFGGYEGDVDDNNKVTTFAKILTPSDANNGGGFSVPRFCADSVFPPLDFDADPPVQKLFITDIHGVVWDFRHIFRGTPRRHLLTTGWSKFVNNKKLIAGDSVVFMKKSAEELFIGVRRAPISSKSGEASYYGGDEYNGYYKQSYGGVEKEDEGNAKMFRRTGKGKLTAEAVSEAINKAAQGLPFEVVYYPTAGWSDFVVRAEDVEACASLFWTSGTRVKMAMETEDSSRITWFQGIVSSTTGSPWKQLQITWDEPEILQNVKRVNPWQVEIVPNTTLHPTFPPAKRVKYPQTGGFLSGENGEILYSQRGLSIAPDPSRSLFPYTTFPAGMQGARHYEFESYNPIRFTGENPPNLSTRNFFNPLGIGSPPSDNLSPESNSTNLSFGNDLVGNRGPVSTRANSIQLFGKIIIVQEPSESGLAESGLYEEDGCKESSDNETQLSLTQQGPRSI